MLNNIPLKIFDFELYISNYILNCIFPKHFKDRNFEQNFINVEYLLVSQEWLLDMNVRSFAAVRPLNKTKTRGGSFTFYVN